MILIGRRGGKDDELRDLLLSGRAERPMTVRDYCGDRLAVRYFFRHWFGRADDGKKRCVWSADEVGPTVTCDPNTMPRGYRSRKGDATTDLSQVRALTLRETAMLQTFPEGNGWSWQGVKTADAFRMVGNAVPVRLAEHLGRVLLAAAQGETAFAPGSGGDPVAFSEPDLELIETWDEQWRHASHATRLEWLSRPAVRTAFERLVAAEKARRKRKERRA